MLGYMPGVKTCVLSFINIDSFALCGIDYATEQIFVGKKKVNYALLSSIC